MIDDGTASAGLITRIELCAKDITLDMQELTGRKVSYDDGAALIDALYYLKQDIEDAIVQLDEVLNESAIVN